MASLTFFILLISVAAQSHLFVSADTSLIHNTCNNTNHYKLCVKSLRSNPSSTKADTGGLAAIIVGIAISNANQTTTLLSSRVLRATSTKGSVAKKLARDCGDFYSRALVALEASLEELDSMSYDYAYVQVSAARDYPSVCHNEYRRFPGLAYPLKLAHREVQLEQMCDVALGIIDTIGW